MKFIIEHLEPELFEWCLIEYGHISEIVGKGNLIFTNVKKEADMRKLQKLGSAYAESISEKDFGRMCILSQFAKKTLLPSDRNKFECFLFGGILGDNPPKKRTEHIISELKKNRRNFEERNLGEKQMPTDNAVYVSKNILKGRRLADFKFVDELEIEISDNESVNLPFRYVIDNNKAIISEKLVDHLRNRKSF